MDLILGFHQVNRKGSNFVVVDQFLKNAVFILAPKVCITDVAASLFFQHMVKHFGLPENIISDRDSRFTRNFGQHCLGSCEVN